MTEEKEKYQPSKEELKSGEKMLRQEQEMIARDSMDSREKGFTELREKIIKHAENESELDKATVLEILRTIKFDVVDRAHKRIWFNTRGHDVEIHDKTHLPGNPTVVLLDGVALRDNERNMFIEKYNPVIGSAQKFSTPEGKKSQAWSDLMS